jgi:hypothetical protein
MIFAPKILGIVAAGSLVMAATSYFKGRYDGVKACDMRHLVAAQETAAKMEKVYEKIERKVPYRADRVVREQWLLKQGVPNPSP